MKKIAITAAMLLLSLSCAWAQDDVQKATAEAVAALYDAPQAIEEPVKPNYWSNSFQFELGFSQTGLQSWAKGGYNSITLSTGIDAKANYARDLTSWNNRLQLQYCFLWTADKSNLLQKSNDLMYLESRLAYKTARESHWNYTASFDFRSQFTDSFDSYKQDTDGIWSGTLKSGFLSPAYANIALGMEWVPSSWLTVNVAPLTGGFTICSTESLRKKYGMKLRQDSLDHEVGSNYRSALFQFGAQLKIDFKATINDVLNYETQLVLFTDYLNQPFKENRVNWDNKIAWQAAKFFKIDFSTWMIYDPIVLIDNEQKIQFKEYFAIKFTYFISNKK